MARTMGLGMAVVLVVSIAGCASVDCGAEFNDLKVGAAGAEPVAHINGHCCGLYFLPFVPLLTGDPSKPVPEDIEKSGGGVLVLQDSVRVEPVVDMVTRKAKQLGATKVAHLESRRSSTCLLLFWFKTCQVSATVVK